MVCTTCEKLWKRKASNVCIHNKSLLAVVNLNRLYGMHFEHFQISVIYFLFYSFFVCAFFFLVIFCSARWRAVSVCGTERNKSRLNQCQDFMSMYFDASDIKRKELLCLFPCVRIAKPNRIQTKANFTFALFDISMGIRMWTCMKIPSKI